MKLTPQHNKILDLLSDGQWHCGTEILHLFIKDDRKRISELKKGGFDIISEVCDCGKHNSNTVKRKLNDIKNTEKRTELVNTPSANQKGQGMFTLRDYDFSSKPYLPQRNLQKTRI